MTRAEGSRFAARYRLPAAIIVVIVVTAVVGAYLDWQWWQVYRGLTITLWAGAFLVAAVVLATIRRLRPAALVALAAAVGLLAGQNLGPSRPELRHSEGSLTATLTAPGASSGTTAATCAMDADATELQVSGDPNLRLAIVADDGSIPADIDQREFVGVSVTVGDRWREHGGRPDAIHLWISVGRVEADAPETVMVSGLSSTLDLSWTAVGGRLAFGGLVRSEVPDATGEAIDLAGTIEWTC